MKDSIVHLDLSDVEVKDHLSRTKLDISSLAESIQAIGQINPITVKKNGNKYQIIAGRRRFTALKHIESTTGKKQKVLVVIKDLSQVHQDLIEIDENLMRQDLTEVEFDEALYKRKQLYEQLFPETKKDVAGGIAKGNKDKKNEKKLAFTADASKKLNTSRRTIEKAVSRASKASDKVKKARENGVISPSKVDLLVTLDHTEQNLLLPFAKDSDVSEVKELVAQSKKRGAKAVVLDLQEVKKEDSRLKPLIRDAIRLSQQFQEALESRLTLDGDSKHDSLRSLDELEKTVQKFTSFQRAALGYVKAISRKGDQRKIIREQVQR
jgi:ParB family chromosome partitioning protein